MPRKIFHLSAEISAAALSVMMRRDRQQHDRKMRSLTIMMCCEYQSIKVSCVLICDDNAMVVMLTVYNNSHQHSATAIVNLIHWTKVCWWIAKHGEFLGYCRTPKIFYFYCKKIPFFSKIWDLTMAILLLVQDLLWWQNKNALMMNGLNLIDTLL